MEWYNGMAHEGVKNRVLYATSPDAVTWSAPAIMFNTTGKVGLENEPMIEIEGRRYAVAGSWDVNARTGGGAEHTGPDTPMMRRVYGPGQLGPVFWLGSKVPAGYEQLGYPSYTNTQAVDKQTRTDGASYLAALLDAESLSDWGKPNERVTYQLPSTPNRLITMLRSGGALPGEPSVGSYMLASTCLLDDSIVATLQVKSLAAATYHVCRPGTGLWNVALPGDTMPSTSASASVGEKVSSSAGPWPGYHSM
jgi:hypothetical protein